MAAGIFSGFSQAGVWVKYIGFFVLLLVVCLGIMAIIFYVLWLSKAKKIIILDMVTRRCEMVSGRLKKNKSHQKQLFISKYKKFLPMVQQNDMYLKGKQDVIILTKDNNGLLHTARLPDLEEIKEWFAVTHKLNLDGEIKQIQEQESADDKRSIMDKIKDGIKGVKHKDALNLLSTIYLMPNPAEDLEWLADEQNQADAGFKTGILKHPLLVWISTITLCAVTWIITIVISNS